MIDYPNKLDIIFDKLNKYDIKSIIVGGYIRDKLLNRVSKDIDIEVYGTNSLSKLEEILKEFGSVNSVGRSFGVCKLKIDDLDLDFSLPRSDSKISKGHRGFTIKTDTSLDFKSASSRRDFTINAMGYDVQERKILDPFYGREDLKDAKLKAVDILKFGEDPLRILRAIQFASRFNFSLDKTLFLKCKELIQNGALKELAKERVFDEISKLLLKSKKPSLGILLLKEMEGFSHFKELSLLSSQELKNSLNSLDYLSNFPQEKNRLTLMLSLLTYRLSKKDTLNFLNLLSDKKELINQITKLKESQGTLLINSSNDYELYKLATHVEIELYLSLLNALEIGKNRDKIIRLKNRAKELGILNKKVDAILKGRDLITYGLKPSKEFSQLLNEAYEAQILSQFTSHKEALLWLKKRLNSF